MEERQAVEDTKRDLKRKLAIMEAKNHAAIQINRSDSKPRHSKLSEPEPSRLKGLGEREEISKTLKRKT